MSLFQFFFDCAKRSVLSLTFLLTVSCTHKSVEPPSLAGFKDGIHHWNLEHEDRSYARYDSSQWSEIAANLIAYQNGDGGWPKNIDWLGVLNADSVYAALKESYKKSTLDNRNTFPQIEYLAQVYGITQDAKYKNASLKGLMYLLHTQKDNGGWRGWDVDAITFNDEVTTGALDLFRNIIQGDERFLWLDTHTRRHIQDGYERGLRMVLDCQILQNGVKTAWAQQHDNETLLPVPARSYELAGITANESCDVALFLMGIDHPTDEIIDAVQHAVVWLHSVQIEGMRVEQIPLSAEQIINPEYPFDRVVVEDQEAKPIWARYYELSDNTPFMCTREGQKVWKLADVNPERRTGYDWYGYWPKKVIDAYPGWLKKIGR